MGYCLYHTFKIGALNIILKDNIQICPIFNHSWKYAREGVMTVPTSSPPENDRSHRRTQTLDIFNFNLKNWRRKQKILFWRWQITSTHTDLGHFQFQVTENRLRKKSPNHVCLFALGPTLPWGHQTTLLWGPFGI